MTRLPRIRALIVSALTGSALIAAGCGGGGGGGAGGGGGSGTNPASIIPADAPIYVEATVRPEGDLRANIENAVETLSPISNPGEAIVSQINEGLGEAEMTYEDDIEPWLGERAAFYMSGFPNDEDPNDATVLAGVVETTDSDAAQDFIDKLAETGGDDVNDVSHGGVDYKSSGDFAVGIVDGFLVASNSEDGFNAVVDGADGDSLADNEDYSSAVSASSEDSLANVYIGIDTFLEAVKQRIDPATLEALNATIGDTEGLTALVSFVPGPDNIELSVRVNPGNATLPQPGDVSDFLGSLPGDSFAAFALPDLGKQLKLVVDQIDANGIPPSVPPGELKSQLRQLGIDVDRVAGSIGDVGVFASGTTVQNIEGALIIKTSDAAAARDLLTQVTRLIARSGTPGFGPIPGPEAGFTYASPDLPKPLVVITAVDRIVVGYGEKATEAAITGSQANTLGSNPTYQQAQDALGAGTSISGFVDFGPIAQLAQAALAEQVDAGVEAQIASDVLEKLTYLVFGSGSEGDVLTSKLIVGFGE